MYTFSYILCTSLWAYTQDDKRNKNKPVRVCSTTSSEKENMPNKQKLHEKNKNQKRQQQQQMTRKRR
jgi:uncharacterized protein HemX